MNNFSFGGGGKQRRDEYIGGRPKSDANYGPKKKRFDKKPGFRGNNDRGDRELFKTNCTTCGKPCEVPFRPDGSKPVLCRDCFAKNGPGDRGDFKPRQDFSRGNDRDFRKPERHSTPQHDTTHFVALTKQVTALEAKLDEVLTLLRTIPVSTPKAAEGATDDTPDVAGESEVPKKARTAKKAAAPKKVAKKATKKATKKKSK